MTVSGTIRARGQAQGGGVRPGGSGGGGDLRAQSKGSRRFVLAGTGQGLHGRGLAGAGVGRGVVLLGPAVGWILPAGLTTHVGRGFGGQV